MTAKEEEELKTKFIQLNPSGRVGTTDEVVKAAVFLADNNQSSFITGEFLKVDGGWCLASPK